MGLRHRDPRLQLRHHEQNQNPVAPRPQFRPNHVRCECLRLSAHPANRSGRRQETEPLRQYSDNRGRLAIHAHRSSHRPRITAKSLLEHPPGQHHHIALAFGKEPAGRGARARNAPELRCGRNKRMLGRLIAILQGAVASHIPGHRFERVRLLPPVREIGSRRQFAVHAAVAIGQPHDALGIRVRKRFDQRRAHHTEDRGVHSDTQCQSHHRNRREHRVAPQSADRIANVLRQPFGPRPLPHLARLLRHPRQVAELPQRRGPCLFRRHPAIEILPRLHFDVLAEIALNAFSHAPSEAHDCPSCPAGRRIPAMARASFSHLVVSMVSCRLPFAVSR